MEEDNNTRSFSYALPTYYDGATYPTTIMDVEDSQGNISQRHVFADRNGNYFSKTEDGNIVPVMLQHGLPGVTVTAPAENFLSKRFNDYITTSNDNTRVLNAPHKEYNSHLKYETLLGAKKSAAWEKEHPYLSGMGYALGAAPFAVASTPFVIGGGELVGSATVAPWIDAGLTSYFGAKGLTNLVNGNENWETALDIAPLGRVGKSIYDASTHLLQNTRDYYNLNNFINRYGYTEYKPKLGLIFDDAKLDKLTNQLVRQHNTFTRGISVDEARKYYGFGPEWTDEQIAEYTLTHPHVPTKFNSGGNPDQRAALYTSNSLDLSRQYTTGGGYVGIVQRPITYDSNRSKMLKINDFRFTKQPDNMYSATTDDPYVYSTVLNKPSKPRIDGGAAQRRRGKVNTKYTPVEPTFLDAQANAGASIIRTQRPDDLDFRHYIFYGDPDNSLLELKGLLRYNPSEGIVSTDYAPHSVGFTKKKAFGGKL